MNDKRHGEPLFDFPCSYTFRAYEALIHEGIDLPPIQPSEEPPSPEPIEVDAFTQMKFSAKQWDTITQLKAHILFLEGKINKHLDASKSKPKYKKYI